MRTATKLLIQTLIAILLLGSLFVAGQSTPALRDGQHDWDTFFGGWKMHLKRRLNPLTGSNEWADFESHDVTRKVWGGRANLDEFEAEGASGHIEGLTLRLYNPQSRQWSIHWANAKAPTLENPMIGGRYEKALKKL